MRKSRSWWNREESWQILWGLKRGLSGTQHGIRVSSRGWPKLRKTKKILPIHALNRSRSGSSSHCDVDPESYRTPMVMIFGYVVEDIKVHLLTKFGAIWLGRSPGTSIKIRARVAGRDLLGREKYEGGWRRTWGVEGMVGNIKGQRYFRSLLSICFVIGNSWINLGRRI